MARARGDQLERLRAICLSFPEVTERPSHGAPTWFVRDKTTFVTFWQKGHHGNTLHIRKHWATWKGADNGERNAGLAPVRHVRAQVPTRAQRCALLQQRLPSNGLQGPPCRRRAAVRMRVPGLWRSVHGTQRSCAVVQRRLQNVGVAPAPGTVLRRTQ
jgi:hypothetical protein